MICEKCKRGDVLAHVHLTYDAPLAARGWTVKVGSLNVSKFDVKEVWDKLQIRPLFCHSCGQAYVYDAVRDECNAVNVPTMATQLETAEAGAIALRKKLHACEKALEHAQERLKAVQRKCGYAVGGLEAASESMRPQDFIEDVRSIALEDIQAGLKGPQYPEPEEVRDERCDDDPSGVRSAADLGEIGG